MSDEDEKLQALTQARTGGSMNGLADSALQGVTVSFLAQVFRIDPGKVKTKLVNAPIKSSRRRGGTQTQHLYDLKTAAEFLVEPKMDVAELIKQVRREDLPPAINTAYWDALLKRQKWEENAGELWRTDKVREVLGTTFQTIKFTLQLWPDTIERQHGLSDEQRDLLTAMIDALQQEIFNALVRDIALAETGPQVSDLPEMLGEVEDDDYASSLI
jgi:hypothetical protein